MSALALTLTLGACGSDESDETIDQPTGLVESPAPGDDQTDDSSATDSPAPGTTDGETSTDDQTETMTDAGTPGSDDPAAGSDATQLAGVGDLLQAAEAALAEVPGGFVTMVERDDDDSDRYDVDIADGDTLVEITLDSTFAVVDQETDDLDDDDRAEVDAAELTVDDAVAAAADAGEVGSADQVVEEIELETEDGRVAWEFDLDNDGAADFYVDATTGEIFRS